ncbi:MAG: class I SAM-dependent methyltransferase [bacterium]|nr:class I SAM-dependent methyltransferase [bacterium]
MSLKSYLAYKIGFTDVDDNFQKFYNVSFEIQRFLDNNEERQSVLKVVRPYTHVNYARLKFLWKLAGKVSRNKINGAFVETGVWRGGCAGILAYISKKYNYQNKLYFFDSFEGLPQPSIKDGRDAKIFANGESKGDLKSIKKVKAEEGYIKELLFEKLEIDPTKVYIIKGWFQDTLAKNKNRIGKIAILRLDGDWYESTKVALENLYDLVVPGGYIIIDDYYFWDGCKKAVDEFISNNNLKVEIKRQDASGAYFIK